MAKKGNKLFALAVVGAAAAGAYLYYKNKNENIPMNMEDDDDFDNIDEDLDDEAPVKNEKRPYVSLDFNSVEQKVKEAVNKVADTAGTAASTIGEAITKAGERVEEFFDDRKTVLPSETPESTSLDEDDTTDENLDADLANDAEAAMEE